MSKPALAPEFRYADLLPSGADDTPYRLITTEGVSTFTADGQTFLRVSPEALQRLTAEAMHDISHYLRPAHLAQLRKIIDDPESSGNDRFVALDLLKNVNISAGGVLPMCQDTGTAIVMRRGQQGADRRTTQHPSAIGVIGEEIGEIRLTESDARTPHRAGPLDTRSAQPAEQGDGIDLGDLRQIPHHVGLTHYPLPTRSPDSLALQRLPAFDQYRAESASSDTPATVSGTVAASR